MKQRAIGSLLCLFALLIPLLSGCGKMQVASEVKPDGSLTRTLIYKEPAPPNPDGPPSSPSPFSGMGMGNKLEDILILPTGPEWNITRNKRKDEVVITATRTIPAGSTIQDDIGVRKDTPEGASPFGPSPSDEAPPAPKPKPAPTKPTTPTKKLVPAPKKKPGSGTKSGKPNASGSYYLARSLEPSSLYCAPEPPPAEKKAPEPLLSNTVTVREIAPGRLEYREVIRFRTPPPNDLKAPDPEMTNNIKKLLPPNLASDDKAVQAVTSDMQKAIWRLIFGPGDPILSTLIVNSDLAEYRLKSRLVNALDTSLKTHYAGRISDAERVALVTKMADELGESGMNKTESATSKPPGSNTDLDGMGAPISLFMRVKMPGKVLSTNGDLDPITGEVTWVMYTWAAAIGEIELVTVCEKP